MYWYIHTQTHVHSNTAQRACELCSRALTRLVQYVTVCFVIDQSADRGPLGLSLCLKYNILSNDMQHKKHFDCKIYFLCYGKLNIFVWFWLYENLSYGTCSNYRHLNSS